MVIDILGPFRITAFENRFYCIYGLLGMLRSCTHFKSESLHSAKSKRQVERSKHSAKQNEWCQKYNNYFAPSKLLHGFRSNVPEEVELPNRERKLASEIWKLAKLVIDLMGKKTIRNPGWVERAKIVPRLGTRKLESKYWSTIVQKMPASWNSCFVRALAYTNIWYELVCLFELCFTYHTFFLVYFVFLAFPLVY